jgi:hypothetical protein
MVHRTKSINQTQEESAPRKNLGAPSHAQPLGMDSHAQTYEKVPIDAFGMPLPAKVVSSRKKQLDPDIMALIAMSEKARGIPFVAPKGQYKAIARLKAIGLKKQQLINRWWELHDEQEDIDWWSVLYSFDKRRP